MQNDVIYKNPPLAVKYRENGYFATRYLDATAKANAPIVAKVCKLIVDGDLIAAAREQEDAAKTTKSEQERADYLAKIRNAFKTEINTLRDADHPAVANLERSVAQLTDDEIIRLANAIRAA